MAAVKLLMRTTTERTTTDKYSYILSADANIQRLVEKRLVQLEVLKQAAADKHTNIHDHFNTTTESNKIELSNRHNNS